MNDSRGTSSLKLIAGGKILLAALCMAGICSEMRGADLTANEMLAAAQAAYAEANWEEAAGLYQQFLDSFGTAEEVHNLLPGIRFDLAMSYLQAKNFGAAAETIGDALDGTPPLTDQQKQELAFWRGVCQMQEEDYEAARESLEFFLSLFPHPNLDSLLWRRQNPAAPKIPEARLLIGATYLLQARFAEGAAYLAEVKVGFSEENRGRATILELFGLLQDGQETPGQLERAMEVVVEEFPSLDQLTQIVAFQTMTLQLGASFLDRKEYRNAIRCLQRIWTAERLMRHQQTRLEDLENRLEALEANPRSDPYQKFLLQQMLVKVKREIENFQAMEHFDSALRLRLATAYQAMRRYREAALIMEEMLRRMEPDPIVESASVALVQCWNEAERWPKVVENADLFAETFPDSTQLPMILYMKGIAQQQESEYEEATATFNLIMESHADSDFAPRALFMRGFTALLADDNPAAISDFESFLDRHKDHELAHAALYWRGMGYSLNGEFETTREVMDEYLEKYSDGMFAGAAKFRKAYAAQQMMDFATSMPELNAFLQEHPGHEQEAEALVLLGDAYMNEGFMEQGIAAFKRIPPQQTRFFEEGWFKVGRALKLMEEYDRLRDHMRQFRTEYPRSPRVAEALFEEGWVYRQEGEEDRARQIYWDAIEEYGSDPSVRSVEDLFPALVRLHAGDTERRRYFARLRDLRERAAEQENDTLKMRSLWAEAQARRRDEPDAARLAMLEAAKLANVQTTNPLLLADFAQELYEVGDRQGAYDMFRELIRWNPRAPQRDRALAMLGLIELENGRERTALDYFERFERETSGSLFTGQVLLAKAELERTRGLIDEAKSSLETLLASNATSGEEKAQALFLLGEIFMEEGKPGLAVPYFQRIYVMYGRWRDWVAKAYLRSGEAFEELRDTDSARRTYAELIGLPDLEDFPETAEARKKLERLGGPLPEPEEAQEEHSS